MDKASPVVKLVCGSRPVSENTFILANASRSQGYAELFVKVA